MTWEDRNLIAIEDLDRAELLEVLDLATAIKAGEVQPSLAGKLLGSSFFEPSTRTRLSFEAAMRRLGGEVIGFAEAGSSSAAKGESLHDSIKIVGQLADVVVVRHPLDGAARVAAEATEKPVINAGDGAHQHPTQTLLDLFSMRECQGKLDGLHVAMVGDLRYSRTVHSLAKACAQFDIRLYFVAPQPLGMLDVDCDLLRRSGACFSFHHDLEELIGQLDILYVTRLQKERYPTQMGDGPQMKPLVTLKLLSQAKPSLRVLHPLPRVDELPQEIDQTPYAYYFQQAHNGLYVRQALLALLLGAST